jgi:hypothetical protein
MTTEYYLRSLKTLGLAPFGVATRTALGLKHRQLARLAGGTTVPSPTLWRLLEALIKLKTV